MVYYHILQTRRSKAIEDIGFGKLEKDRSSASIAKLTLPLSHPIALISKLISLLDALNDTQDFQAIAINLADVSPDGDVFVINTRYSIQETSCLVGTIIPGTQTMRPGRKKSTMPPAAKVK